jgi:hypothetical protein
MKFIVMIGITLLTIAICIFMAGCSDDGAMHIPSRLYHELQDACRPHHGIRHLKKIGYGKFVAECEDGHKIEGISR